MRILFVASPGLGHFLPVVGTAWAARAAGHSVLISTTGGALTATAQAGLPAFDAVPGFDIGEVFRAHPGAFNSDNLEMVAQMFGDVSDHMADRTVEVARCWRPDLVVHTPLDGSGPLAAALLSVPLVQHGFGLTPAHLFYDMLVRAMGTTFDRHGLDGLPAGPAARLDTSPPSMAEPGSLGWSMRYVPYNGGGALPDWLLEPPPPAGRICVTLGTVIPVMGSVAALRGILECVRDLAVEVVLALGEADVSGLEPLPPNVRRSRWLPLSELLPTCDAVVHHGGSGTTMNALFSGVPQLVLPHGADQHLNGAAVARRGVGLTLLPQATEADEVRNALRRLLHDPEIRRAADEVGREIAELPTPAELMPKLSGLGVQV